MSQCVRWAASVALLSTGAPALAQDKPPADPDTISWMSMAPWGTSSRGVAITSDGKVVMSSYQQQRPPAPCPPPNPGAAATCASAGTGRTVIRFSIGIAGFAEIRAILAPLEKKAAKPGEMCRIYDAGNASIGWKFAGKQASYELGFSCNQRQNQWADGLANAAEAKLREFERQATDRTQVSE